jgi:hypothetical protein
MNLPGCRTNSIIGLCGWHMDGINAKVDDYSDIKALKEAVDAGHAHVAKEFITFAVAGLGRAGYHARAVEGMPVSKITDGRKQFSMLKGIVDCW